MTGAGARQRVLFRCDASVTIGGGHVMRCLTLANMLAGNGADITFACTPETLQTVQSLAEAPYRVKEINNPLDPIQILASNEVWDLAVLDHYQLDACYESRLRAVARQILVIDDLADRAHDCDILLDQTTGRDKVDYRGLVPDAAQLLCGAEYALLRPEFAKTRPAALARRQAQLPVRRILVALSLSDVGAITEKIVKALLASELEQSVGIDVVSGSTTPCASRLRELAKKEARISLHFDSNNMCELMMQADLAVGAAGMSSLERCCLGLPSITLLLAENQRKNIETLSAKKAIFSIGAIDSTFDEKEFIEIILQLAKNNQLRKEMSDNSSNVTDGLGISHLELLEEIPGF